MAVLSKEEFFNSITDFVGDAADDKTIKFLDDMQDTYNNLQKKVEDAEGTDWQKRYEENDRAWRLRYKKRWDSHFDGNPEGSDLDPQIEEMKRAESITVDDLFKGEQK